MARTSKPLRLLVHPDLLETIEVQALIAKGHDVTVMQDIAVVYDLILGPNCWRIYPKLYKYIDMAVKAARLVRYPKKEKE